MGKGDCVICERTEIKIVALGCCGSCYPIVRKKFGGNISKAQAWRKKHPVHARKSQGAVSPQPESSDKPVGGKDGFAGILVNAFSVIEKNEKVIKACMR